MSAAANAKTALKSAAQMSAALKGAAQKMVARLNVKTNP